MTFDAIRKNKVFANISEFTVSTVLPARSEGDVMFRLQSYFARIVFAPAKFRENQTLTKITKFTVNKYENWGIKL